MSELERLAADLALAGSSAQITAGKVVEKHALRMKNFWKAAAMARNSRHARRFPFSISYDMEGATTAVIGPESGRDQGFLGAVFEYGGVYSPPFASSRTSS